MKQSRRLFNLVKGEPYLKAQATEGAASLYLYDEISYFGVTAADFVAELSELGGQDFTLHVNSPGGDVFEGLAMLNSLRAYKGKVTVYVDGLAASAASFLIMGADEVVMCANSELMIHDAWGMCLGNAADMVDMAQRLDKVSDNIADVYAGRGTDTRAAWRERMRAEAWYGPDEAVAVGLADRALTKTVPSDDGAVAYDLSRFKNHKTPSTAPAVAVEAKESEVDPLAGFDIAALLRGAFEEAV